MHSIKQFISRHHRLLLIGLGVTYIIVTALQFIYPSAYLLPFSRVDTVDMSGWKKADATAELDRRLNEKTIPVIVTDSKLSYEDVLPASIGLTISNKDRIDALDYPFWARLIPTSVLWYKNFQKETGPSYDRNATKQAEFIQTTLGSCNLKPKNATLQYVDKKLEVVPAKDGGTCDSDEVSKELALVSPTVSSPSTINLNVAVTPAAVKTEAADALHAQLQSATADGIKLKVLTTDSTIPKSDVLSWLDFKAKKDKLEFSINEKRSNAYFTKSVTPKVLKTAGITKVKTRDFTETSRKEGAKGRTLNTSATRDSIQKVLKKESEQATAATTTLKPKVEYSRSYTKSSTGISALITHYDEDHAGVFGVSFRELGGSGKSAQYNSNKQFTSASTYKLFVAFSTLKKVDKGDWEWSDKNIASGRNLSTCFDDMIVKSDNACAEALIKKVSRSKLDSDLRSIGLGSSSFQAYSNGPSPNVTTASDLVSFLTKLQGGSLGLKEASRDKLLSAMKRNVYRQGIPAGASGTTANKVGFLWGLLHDAGIVYSSKGTYALAIMSDGSSWGSIAELTRKIESLR